MKNVKFSLTEKKFRQINYLVFLFVKPLLSQNFCEKSVRENVCNFHTMEYPQWISEECSHGFLSKIMCEIILFTKKHYWKLIPRNFMY